MANTILPNTISLATAAKSLGLEGTHSYTHESLKTLLRIIDENDVPMYLLDTEIVGVAQGIIDEECEVDETGYIHQFERLNSELFHSPTPDIRVRNARLDTADDGCLTFSISKFEVDGRHYHVSDHEGSLGETNHPLSNLCVTREGITRLRQKFNPAPEATAKAGKTGPSKQEQRELALRFWLITKANEIPGSPDRLEKDLQKCYAAIASPTQETIWAALYEIDSQLFAHGDKDFFRNLKLIDFKYGTGKNR